MAGRDRNVEVFKALMQRCRKDKALSRAIENSIAGQYILHEYDELSVPDGHRFASPANIIVSKKRSLEAASAYAVKGRKTCVLNFASATRPGGGVTTGAGAQEECLCRCSTLYPCISDAKTSRGFHERHVSELRSGMLDRLYNDDCIFTPGVVVCNTDTADPEPMPENRWYSVDVISCAAPNLRSTPNAYSLTDSRDSRALSRPELSALHEKRIRRVLDLAKVEGAEVIILGAFGCGAFENPPDVVAWAMRMAVKDYLYDFDTIEFAVYCTPRDRQNYEKFRLLQKG